MRHALETDTSRKQRIVEDFCGRLVAKHAPNLTALTPGEAQLLAIDAITRLDRCVPLVPKIGMVDLFGFGATPHYFIRQADDVPYVLLTEAGRALGMTQDEAYAWVRDEHTLALNDQRELDEDRGLLGYEYVGNFIRLGIHCHSHGAAYEEWLISKRLLTSLIIRSPWAEEFLKNAGDLLAYANQDVIDEDGFPLYQPDGRPIIMVDPNLARLPLSEARRRAVRGPILQP